MNRRALIFGFSVLPVLAQGNSHGKGKGKGHGGGAPGGAAGIMFTESDRGMINDWMRRQTTANLPPGLAKRGGSLPPGLEKQLRKNGRLPPGLDRGTWSPFPPDLVRVLPPLPPNYDRGFIGGRAAIILKGTQIVVDIFKPL